MFLFRSQTMSFTVFMIVFLTIRILLMGKLQIVLGDPSEITQVEVLHKNSDASKVNALGKIETHSSGESTQAGGEVQDQGGGQTTAREKAPINLDELLGIESDSKQAGKGRKDRDNQHLPSDWRRYLRPDIDIIMNQEELTKITTNGEIEFKANKYGQPYVDLKVRTHGGFRRVQLERAFLPFLPEQDWGGDNRTEARYKTCALVGNSGTIIGTGHGKDIDKHDAVIRINYAPTRGFQYDVGNKTTFDIANKENCLKLAKGEHRWRRPASTLIMWEAHSRAIRNQVYLKVLKSRGVQGKRLWLLSPSVVTVSRMVWLAIKKDIEQDIVTLRKYMAASLAFDRTHFTPFVIKKAQKLGPWRAGQEDFTFHNKPMSGIVSLFFAIQVCDSVDMYGFDPFTIEARSRYHYFDDRAGMVNVHSFDMAMEIFRRLSKAFPVRIHSRGSKINSFVPQENP